MARQPYIVASMTKVFMQKKKKVEIEKKKNKKTNQLWLYYKETFRIDICGKIY